MIIGLTILYLFVSIGTAAVLTEMHLAFQSRGFWKTFLTFSGFFILWPLVFTWVAILVLKDLLTELVKQT